LRQAQELTSPLDEHDEAVEQGKAVGSGRVYGGANRDAPHSQLLDGAHDLIARVRVQARGGLICGIGGRERDE